mgnify:CR=1 FL=1
MKLFETRTAPNPRRVRMFLAEKGLLDQVELVQVDIEKGENLSPEFVARNPMKKVPVLELDDGHVGLVHAIGSNYLTRFVNRGEMAAMPSETEEGVVDLITGDITWPRAHMHFADIDTAGIVAGMFASTLDETANKRAA